MNSVIVLDEVYRAASHDGEDALKPLYSCLEPVSASKFADEFLALPSDASHVSWLLTANEIDRLPGPILDRLVVVEVPSPDAAQLRPVEEVFDEANAARRGFFLRPGADVLDHLATASPRRMRRAVEDAMARAASIGRRALAVDDVVAEPRAPQRGARLRVLVGTAPDATRPTSHDGAERRRPPPSPSPPRAGRGGTAAHRDGPDAVDAERPRPRRPDASRSSTVTSPELRLATRRIGHRNRRIP